MTAPTRPLLRWLGGKYRLAPWIIAHFPPHRIYVEPYGGAASVLLAKPRAYNEIWNDLDGELVNLFAVLREGARADRLLRMLELTPYARVEYLAALEIVEDPVERARRLIVRSHMSHGTTGSRLDRPTGYRSDGISGTTNVAGEWADLPSALQAIVERLRGVNVESIPALELMRRYSDPKALFYLDPPYLPATRSDRSRKPEGYHTYRHELSVADHIELLGECARSRAMIVLSGYPSALYSDALAGWRCVETDARAHRNSPRRECLWINPAALAACQAGPLFEEEAA